MAKNIVSAISEAPSVMSNQLAEPFTDCITAMCSCFRTHNEDTGVLSDVIIFSLRKNGHLPKLANYWPLELQVAVRTRDL